MTISVVIPAWNGLNDLRSNLPLILEAKPRETIVIDDCSEDGTADYLRTHFPQVKTYRNTKNLNFAYTVNRGVEIASGELVSIVNTDVRPDPDFLKKSVRYFRDPLLFGVSLHEIGNGPAHSKFVNGFIGYERGEESDCAQPTFWLSGGSCIVRKAVWDSLGGYDAQLFPYYWEDLDISYRASKRGYKLLWIPDSRVIHHHETSYSHKYSDSKLSFEKEKRQLAFIWKNLTSPQLFKQHLSGLTARVLKSPGYVRVIVASLPDIQMIVKKRNEEKQASRLTDEAVIRAAIKKTSKEMSPV